MIADTTAEFKVTSWDESEKLDADGGSKVTQASVRMAGVQRRAQPTRGPATIPNATTDPDIARSAESP